ncbi:MAG TPA: CheR family methyltransferase [bacterium]|nr:CheR family methyltransferase [bacterium]HOL47212.1 CheR family methyltransferase [bacterium]HPQ18279.1 CheR family methyltransferase [bacterium]
MFLKHTDFEKLRDFIFELTGIYLKDTKIILLSNRIRKRLHDLKLESFEEYIEYLFKNKEKELENFINVVTTNETYFFREEKHWNFLKEIIINEFNNNSCERTIKIWSSACSSGEEPYTALIILLENLKENIKVEIIGTDINTSILEKAKKAIYNEDRLQLVSKELKEKYFIKEADKYRLKTEYTKMVKFYRHNLLQPFLMKEFDIIICRNVLIYFNEESKNKVVENLTNSLKINGYLFLGHSENINESKFNLKFVKSAIYQKVKENGK